MTGEFAHRSPAAPPAEDPSGDDWISRVLAAFGGGALDASTARRMTLTRSDAAEAGRGQPDGVPGWTLDLGKGEGTLLSGWPLGLERSGRPGVFLVLGSCSASATLTVLASRWGRNPHRHPEWFEAIRTRVAHLDSRGALLVHPEQTARAALRRAARAFDRPVVELRIASLDHAAAAYRRARQQRQRLGSAETIIVEIVPDFPPRRDAIGGRLEQRVAELSDDILALHVRPGGNVERAMASLLSRGDRPAGRVQILAPPPARPRWEAAWRRLVDAGAMPWTAFPSARRRLPATAAPPVTVPVVRLGAEPASPGGLTKLADHDVTRFVAHFTRAASGRWSDESTDAYWDRCLFGGSFGARDAAAALRRILADRCLRAGNRMTRHRTRVVCFTDRPLSEFAARRTFRAHLGRWDYEPFGVAVDRDWLAQHGGRPVIYGTPADWAALSEADRPFFQIAASRSGRVDWTAEREWRVLGDLDLTPIPAEGALVFVATHEQAKNLAGLSPWPIVPLRSD